MKKVFLLYLFLNAIFTINAQERPDLFRYQINYDLETVTTTSLPEGAERELDQLELLDLQNSTEVAHVEAFIDEKGEALVTSVYEKPENHPDWLTFSSKSVLNSEGSYAYDERGEVLDFQEHSESTRGFYDFMKTTLVESLETETEFGELDEQQEEMLRKNEFEIQREGELLIMKNRNTEVTIDKRNLTVEQTIYDDEHVPVRTLISTFTKNDKKGLTPERKIQITKIFIGKICATLTKVLTYTNYTVKVGGVK